MEIIEIEKNSPSYEAGIRIGDRIVRIDGRSNPDFLDIYLYREEPVEIEVLRNGSRRRFFLPHLSGIRVRGEYRSCQNRCFFCFVDGLPKGLRKSLYFKDDDYRLSFLFGNYISMTNLTPSDLDRIISLSLSPLYISVHTTDPYLRQKLFGNVRAGEIMDQLRILAENGIAFHTQIVVIPGYNDGDLLRRTIDDLIPFSPSLRSVAIVPAGRTRYNLDRIPATTPTYAQKLIGQFESEWRRYGDLIQLADEYYLLAGLPVPPASAYGEFPQLENGCGMVAKLYQELSNLTGMASAPVDLYLITGSSPRDFLAPLLAKLNLPEDRVIRIENRLFGPTVWVSGLIPGTDLLNQIKGRSGRFLIPTDAVADGEFIDGVPVDSYPSFLLAPASIPDLIELVNQL
ncbi:hypothetical protein DRP53_07240 [candidate division WOR-3 bacterium]|uniref:PDZ domain-containing protein n=1 Tax=candidate division WOR-3 bacterium TaxID=2052148 RepID=A0A660SGB3_UNCW3|nr:MAG: hypothetical protein DRP53_07240 [candidate division WOR-3 bacterium]